MKSCKEILKLSSPDHTKKLTIKELLEIKMHNLVCKLCKNYEKQMSLISKIYKEKSDIKNKQKKDSIKALEDKIISQINNKTGS